MPHEDDTRGRRWSRRALMHDTAVRVGGTLLGAGIAGLGVPEFAGAAGPAIDPDVQEVYDRFVRVEMPGVPVELVQAAKREGTVTFYCDVLPAEVLVGRAFQDRFPFMRVEEQPLSGGALAQRFMAESAARAHLADVCVFTSFPDAEKALAAHYVMQYTCSAERDLQTTHYVPGYILPAAADIMAVAYNPQRISDADAQVFRAWGGLMAPRWHGKRFAVADVLVGGTTQMLNYYEYTAFGTRLWAALASSGYGIYAGGMQEADSVISGETDIAAGMPGAQLAAKWATGAPIHWVYPAPHLVVPFGMFISANAPHPNAAKLFEEYYMSRPGQEFLVAGGNVTFRSGVTPTAKYIHEPWYVGPDPKKYWPYTDAALAAAMPDIVTKWRAIFK